MDNQMKSALATALENGKSINDVIPAEVLAIKTVKPFVPYTSGDNAFLDVVRIAKSKAGNDTLFLDFVNCNHANQTLQLTINNESVYWFYKSIQKLRYLVKNSGLEEESAEQGVAYLDAIRNQCLTFAGQEHNSVFTSNYNEAEQKFDDIDYALVRAKRNELLELGFDCVEFDEKFTKAVGNETLEGRKITIAPAGFKSTPDLSALESFFKGFVKTVYSMETKVSKDWKNENIKYNDILFINPETE